MFRRVLAYLIGCFVLTLGVSLIIRSNMGAAPWDTLYVGLAAKVGLTVGTWIIIVGVLLVAVNSILMREKPDWVAIPLLFFLGLLVDGWLYLIAWESNGALFKMFMTLLGILLTTFGTSIYMQAQFGMTSLDRFMFAVSQKTGLSIRASKILIEIIPVIFAFFLGGPIGVATIAIVLLAGPLIQFFIPRVRRVILSEENLEGE